MALIKCPDCEKMISPRAKMCPFCGCPSDFWGTGSDNSVKEDAIVSAEEKHTAGESEILSANGITTVKADESSLKMQDSVVDTSSEDAVEVEINDVTFGVQSEQYPNTNKYPFTVIVDSKRETDKHAKGKTHVLFKIGESKYLTVSKDDLFYAPINYEVDAERINAKGKFKEYLANVNTLGGMTTGAKHEADSIMQEYCQFLVKKLIQFGIYEYDLSSFMSLCGSTILIEDTDSYESILKQEKSVDSYARDLSRQREAERASRSQWQGGGFGVKGAIKGAVTAGAMNAATGAFRSVGDGITDAGDRSTIQSKYDAIVSAKNKNALDDAFGNGCLFRAMLNFYHILERKTGWNDEGVSQQNWKAADAKLNNLQHIEDKSIREKILIELLSNYPYHYGVLNYAISHYIEYDIDLGHLVHFMQRIYLNSYDYFVERNFTDILSQIEKNTKGEDRKQTIINMAIIFGFIDENFNIIDGKNRRFGFTVIMRLMEADMSVLGLSLNKLEVQTEDFDKAYHYFNKLIEVGSKYHVFETSEVGNELAVTGSYSNDKDFVDLQEKVNRQLKKICTVRGVLCEDIQKAKLLASEWREFNEMYSPFNSYADYDSKVMQEVIEKAQKRNFTSIHIQNLISGEDGLESKRNKLEEREKSEIFKNSQQVIKQMIPHAGERLFVYGSKGFLAEAKAIRDLDKIQEKETDIFPLVIYNAFDSLGFKGFVVTDKYFYNYNSMWGIGFGDKALSLYDIRETTKNGKNRLFKFANGRTEKVKIIEYEDIIIGVLSEVFGWESDLNRRASNSTNLLSEERSEGSASEVVNNNMKICPVCSKQIAIDADFCTFCGNRVRDNGVIVERVPCINCGKMIKGGEKFCTFCGATVPETSILP